MKSFEKVTRLSEKQQNKIQKLADICHQHDGLPVKLYWNILRDRRTYEYNDFFIHYEDEFVGYLGIFHFKEEEVEITAMVHPDFRLQGIFQFLAMEAFFELQKRQIPNSLFAVHHGAEPAVFALEAMGATYGCSEYSMELEKHVPMPDNLQEVKLTHSGIDDIELLVELDNLSFGTPKEVTFNRFITSLDEPNRRIWLAYVNDEVIGKMHVRFDQDTTFIHDFCVVPEHQARGYGYSILMQTLKYLEEQNKKHVSLDLVAENKNALKLYEKCGFKVISAYDYWRKDIDLGF